MNQKCCPFAGDFGLLFIRIALAVVFIYHGYGKITDIPGTAKMFHESLNIPMPMLSATLAALAEFGGGILVLVGLLTRLAVIPMIFTMGVAIFWVHWPTFPFQDHGYEYALVMALVLIGLGLLGPGRFSLDALIFRRKCCAKSNPEDAAE
jgi:putative oxidoreductase